MGLTLLSGIDMWTVGTQQIFAGKLAALLWVAVEELI